MADIDRLLSIQFYSPYRTGMVFRKGLKLSTFLNPSLYPQLTIELSISWLFISYFDRNDRVESACIVLHNIYDIQYFL